MHKVCPLVSVFPLCAVVQGEEEYIVALVYPVNTDLNDVFHFIQLYTTNISQQTFNSL